MKAFAICFTTLMSSKVYGLGLIISSNIISNKTQNGFDRTWNRFKKVKLHYGEQR
jgi:hypothetical protein